MHAMPRVFVYSLKCNGAVSKLSGRFGEKEQEVDAENAVPMNTKRVIFQITSQSDYSKYIVCRRHRVDGSKANLCVRNILI